MKIRSKRTIGYRPSIRLGKHGHPMRGPEGHQADSGQTQNNGGGNSQSGTGESNANNNNGQEFDLGTFWNDEEAEPQGNQQQQTTTTPPNQQQQQELPPAQRLMSDIQALDFGVPVMTPAVMQELADGKTEGFDGAMKSYGQAVTTQTVKLVVGLMGQLRQQMEEKFSGEVNQRFDKRDTDADLLAAIPSAANPAVRPMVDQIMARSMKHSKGDRKAAIALTKDMLRLTAQTTGADIGLPPPSAGDQGSGTQSNVNWLDELTGRS